MARGLSFLASRTPPGKKPGGAARETERSDPLEGQANAALEHVLDAVTVGGHVSSCRAELVEGVATREGPLSGGIQEWNVIGTEICGLGKAK